MIGQRDHGQEPWRTVLPLLDPNPERAGAKYELIRSRLVRLFELQGHAAAADLADRTIDRVADKLSKGETVRSDDVYRYFAGVARMLALEVTREERRVQRAAQASRLHDDVPEERAAHERRFIALDKCLGRLTPDNRELVLEYYRDNVGRHIDARKTLSERLGLSLNALCIRVHRIRKQLEGCVHMRLESARAS
jgi:DNA-directed RNA polymerase specialized sigma24 family protein